MSGESYDRNSTTSIFPLETLANLNTDPRASKTRQECAILFNNSVNDDWLSIFPISALKLSVLFNTEKRFSKIIIFASDNDIYYSSIKLTSLVT